MKNVTRSNARGLSGSYAFVKKTYKETWKF